MEINIKIFSEKADELFALQNAEFETELYIFRKTRMDTKIQRYFNSTPLRNVFARLMVTCFYEDKPASISFLASKIMVTRQTISTLVKECEAEEYIIVTRQSGKVVCKASENLILAYEDYCSWKKTLLLQNKYFMLNEIGNINNIVTKL